MCADGESGCVAVDHECSDAFLCAEETDVKGSALAVGRESLGSVEDIIVAVLDCSSLQSAGIRTCVGLGDREACEFAFLNDVCKILDLLGCACKHNISECHKSSNKGICISCIHLCQLFVHHSCGLKAESHSAVLFRNLSKVKSHLQSRCKKLIRASAGAVAFGNVRLDFFLSHFLDHCDQFFLLVGVN